MSFASNSNTRTSRCFIVLVAAFALLSAAAFTHICSTHASTRPAFGGDKKIGGLAPDKGKFKILVNGQVMGKEEFEIGSSGGNWLAHGNSEITTPQGVTKVTGTLTARPDGTPEHYDWSTQGAKKASAAIAFNADVATAELHMDGSRPYTQQFTFNSPMVVILDDNMYHQYQILAALYDMEKKGPQTFAVLVPQELTPGVVTVDSLGKQDVDNKKMEELRVKTEDNEIDLYLDGNKLMRLVAPAANAEVVREKD
ncbi:MAG: hypothetical protein WA823_07760 [Candidatus Acidiferrales bacterium]